MTDWVDPTEKQYTYRHLNIITTELVILRDDLYKVGLDVLAQKINIIFKYTSDLMEYLEKEAE